MLKTNRLLGIEEVPDTWIFENYLPIEPLGGQDAKLKSPFNPKDSRPSAYVYYSFNAGRYRFKDFSTGIECDAVELVQRVKALPDRNTAIKKILDDYQKYIDKGGKIIKEKIVPDIYEVIENKPREWNVYDEKYWTKFNIGTRLLNQYGVKPLQYYRSKVTSKSGSREYLHGNREYIYGYYKSDGSLYKIYQPVVDPKFIKLFSYIHGIEQLTYQKPNLLINSSLKDIMSFMSLGFVSFESVAPESENQIINASVMASFLQKYERIFVLMDNDEPGKNASMNYKERYPDVKIIELSEYSKDLSDSIKDFGPQQIKTTLYTKFLTHIK